MVSYYSKNWKKKLSADKKGKTKPVYERSTTNSNKNGSFQSCFSYQLFKEANNEIRTTNPLVFLLLPFLDQNRNYTHCPLFYTYYILKKDYQHP